MRPIAARPARIAIVVLAACSGVVLAGCSKTIDSAEVQDTIATQFKAQGVTLTKIDCNDDVEAEVGAKISCTAENAAAQATLNIEGEVTEVDGDRGRFSAKAVSGTSKGPFVAASAKKIIEDQTSESVESMTCPAVVQIPTKPSVDCTLVSKGRRYAAKVSIDGNSRFNVNVAPKPIG
jgi:hypothetical protein